ncbi:MAG: MepB family protein, partial [Chitinophagaceae bacterium]|nr:MepB family protein [Chitinophagaceae bacterium]
KQGKGDKSGLMINDKKSSDKKTDNVFIDLDLVSKALYCQAGMAFSQLSVQKEGRAYAACTFKLNGKKVQHRSAKITPTKQGLFVTIWKRNKEGLTAPLDAADYFDLLLITCSQSGKTGQFIFPKSILIDQKVISVKDKGGRRGMRVYPPWEKPDNEQARKTQAWQADHFIDLDDPDALEKLPRIINSLV